MMLIAAGLLLLAFQTAPQEDTSKRVSRALEWFADTDPEVRELGRKELIAIGREAIPYLERLLDLRNALDIYKLLREVDRERNPFDPRWVSERALPSDEEIEKGLTTEQKNERERYVRRKYSEAAAAAKRARYQEGYDIANALLILEPKSVYADRIKELRRYCDNWVTQTSLLRSRVIPSARAGVAGEKAEFTLRMENVFKQALTVHFDPGSEEKPFQPIVVVEVTCNMLDGKGGVDHATRTFQVPIEPDVPIAVGAQWERVFTLDTAQEFPGDEDHIRVYTVGAWTQPQKIEFGIGSTMKRLLFEPAAFKTVPRKHDHMLEDPLATLRKAIGAGTVNEVFIAAMLVPDASRHEAVGALVDLLEQKDREARQEDLTTGARREAVNRREFAAHVLTNVTGEKLGSDPKKWRQYHESLIPRAKK